MLNQTTQQLIPSDIMSKNMYVEPTVFSHIY